MNSGKSDKIEMYWKYTPKDFFEEPIDQVHDGYSVKMDDGQITSRTTGTFFDSHPELPDQLTVDFNAYFQGTNLIRRKPFEIRPGGHNRICADGKIHTVIMVDSVKMSLSTEPADVVVTNADGTVKTDTRKERIDMTGQFAELAAEHSANATAVQILNSYNKSISEPENELIYLYDVWETLKESLPKKQALSIIGVTQPQRSRLTRLANDEPLRQGRHRGKHAENLRYATEAELKEARDIARQMIVGYLRSLDARGNARKERE